MEMTCINCPMGCQLTVTKEGDEIIVKGNTCARGAQYGKQEFLLPMRTVTSLVRIADSTLVAPVKTDGQIPKDKIFDVLRAIKDAEAHSPVHIGDVIISNVLGLNVNVVATKNV